MKIKIAPSILSADFSKLGSDVEEAIQAGADYIHVDVMDGHFVPNITVGPLIVAALKPIVRVYDVPLDVHLMVEKPDNIIPAFVKAGADILTVHVEACTHLHRSIQMIKESGIKAGVTLNPATSLSMIEEVLPYVDMVLIMSVNPGFGGQVYIPSSTNKISRLKQMLDSKSLSSVEISVDGGISADTAAQVVAAGANVLIAGSAVFNSKASIADNMKKLRQSYM
jgi:ribulose-phosphate 3-epimerase